MQVIQIDGQTFKFEGKVGEGCTAEVFKATSCNHQTVCVKVIKDHFYKQPTGKSLIDNQVKILGQLNHQNILKFRKQHRQKNLMIVTEYCLGGTLYDLLRRRGSLSEAETLTIMRQLVEGCSYMHARGVIHRDLKPENIFFRDKGQKEIAIADFGFAVSLTNKTLMRANVGSPLYMPYQALADNTFSPLSDIFALGVIWYELLTGRTPFQAASERQLKQLTKKQKIRSRDVSCASNIKEIIFKCLKCSSQERPSLNDILTLINQNSNQKTKSKSVFLPANVILKVQERRPSKERKPSKDKKVSKQNKDPLLCHPGVTRNERCKTNLQNKKPFKPVEKTTKTLKIDTGLISGQLLSQTKKHFSQQSLLSTDKLLSLLRNLSSVKMSFLPESIQLKFRILLTLYQKLLTGKTLEGNSPPDDDLISTLTECKHEQDFCIGSFGFLRRLLRLAKTYSVNTQDLTQLWNHVQAKCLVRA